MEDALSKLRDNYYRYMEARQKTPEIIQTLFSSLNTVAGGNHNQWHCGGCIRRVLEETKAILEKNNLLKNEEN